MNMTKQYRTELRQLHRLRQKLNHDLLREQKACDRACDAVIYTTARRLERARTRCHRATADLNRRIAVLEGRLA